MRARKLICFAAIAAAVAACGGDDSGSDSSEAALANAAAIEAAVDVSLAEAEFTAVEEPVPVDEGDVVRTDSSGFAEVTYFDGSVTRLDVDTSFTVVELSDSEGGSVVRTDMRTGRTWNRVEQLAEGDEFVVETSVATAAVRGTAFVVDCPDATSCTFSVVEGTVELTLPDGSTVDVEAPSAVTISDGTAAPAQPLPYDGAFGDPWLADNGERDTEAGFASPAEVYEAHGPAFASLAGTYTATIDATAPTCDGGPCTAAIYPGEVEASTVTGALDVVSDCTSAGACTITLNDVSFTATYAGSTVTGDAPFTTEMCRDGTTDAPLGERQGADRLTLTVTSTGERDGAWVVTGFDATVVREDNVTVPHPTCVDFGFPSTEAFTQTITASR